MTETTLAALQRLLLLRYDDLKARLARQLRAVANTRDQHLDRVSARLAHEHSLVVLEDLRIRNMTRSAAGTVEEPGTNVSQKGGG